MLGQLLDTYIKYSIHYTMYTDCTVDPYMSLYLTYAQYTTVSYIIPHLHWCIYILYIYIYTNPIDPP